jgi:8-oxo-dGTP pyrophosphatase MutT (NUDIX family)
MNQNYRIYINDNSLFVTQAAPIEVENIQVIDFKEFDFKTFYKNVRKEAEVHYMIIHKDPKAVLKTIKESCQLIKAAGGLVRNADGEYLFIFRNKRWDLPKGKVEKGEKMKEAALREVEEECGVKISKNKDRLCRTYHIYELGGKIVLKKTNWYNMNVKGSPRLIPQKEEGITKAEWLNKKDLKPILKNTYPLIIDILRTASLI